MQSTLEVALRRLPRRGRAAQRSGNGATRHHGRHRAARHAVRRRGRASVLALGGSAHHRRADRYRWLVEQLQYVARRELVFGMHVHVAVPDPDLAMHVMESLLAELPVLLALSSSSPFWRGEATGLASTRTAIFASMPRSGQPPRFSSYEDYLEMVGTMEDAGTIDDYTYLWWDVRPHPRLRHGRDPRHGRPVRPRSDAHARSLRAVQRRACRRRGRARGAAAGASPPARLGEQVGRGALRTRRPADGSRGRSAHEAARLGARAAQRRAARALCARARLCRCSGTRSSARSRGATAPRA